jgi:hypothetical protein
MKPRQLSISFVRAGIFFNNCTIGCIIRCERTAAYERADWTAPTTVKMPCLYWQLEISFILPLFISTV